MRRSGRHGPANDLRSGGADVRARCARGRRCAGASEALSRDGSVTANAVGRPRPPGHMAGRACNGGAIRTCAGAGNQSDAHGGRTCEAECRDRQSAQGTAAGELLARARTWPGADLAHRRTGQRPASANDRGRRAARTGVESQGRSGVSGSERRRSQALRSLHHARSTWLRVSKSVRLGHADSSGAGIRDHPPRDDSRGSRDSARPGPAASLASAITSYMGDPRGWWEGDTLVVETTNFNGKTGSYARNGDGNPTSTALRLVERFRLQDSGTLLYEVLVEDPQTWMRPWKVAFPLTRDDSYVLYEYACHEGNYAISNILRAARAAEARRLTNP